MTLNLICIHVWISLYSICPVLDKQLQYLWQEMCLTGNELTLAVSARHLPSSHPGLRDTAGLAWPRYSCQLKYQPWAGVIYKDFIRQKHWAWFVPPVVLSDTPSSVSTTVKEAAETHTADSARQQVSFIDSAVREVSHVFAPLGESPDSSSEGSQRGSPRSSPRQNRGVSPHRVKSRHLHLRHLVYR